MGVRDHIATIQDILDGNIELGGGSGSGAFPSRQTFIASADQDTFNFNYSIIDNVPQIDVWFDGFKLQSGIDFTATDRSTIILTTPASEGSIIDVVSYIAGYIGTQREEHNFTATEGQDTFNVTYSLSDNIDVYRLGHKLADEDFTATDQATVILTEACNLNDPVTIIVFKETVTSNTVGSPEQVSTKPIWAAEDEGRFIYTTDTDKYYLGDASKWREVQFVEESLYPTDRLVMEFKGDISGVTALDSIGPYSANIFGTVANVAGKIGDAISFNGTNTFFYPRWDDTHFTPQIFSISFWLYPLEDGGERIFAIYGDSGTSTNRRGFDISISSGTIILFCLNGDTSLSTVISSGANSISLNEWTHVCVVRESEDSNKIYINGELTVTGSAVISYYSSAVKLIMSFGTRLKYGAWGEYLNGYLNLFRFYTKALTADEVSILYNDGQGI